MKIDDVLKRMECQPDGVVVRCDGLTGDQNNNDRRLRELGTKINHQEKLIQVRVFIDIISNLRLIVVSIALLHAWKKIAELFDSLYVFINHGLKLVVSDTE